MKKNPTRKEKTKMNQRIKTGEKGDTVFTNWDKHMINRQEIESFTTIIKDQLYNFIPKPDEIFLPFSEFYGDHAENWIIILDKTTNKELARKSTRTVDMINWKLSSSPTKTKINGK